MGKKLNVCNCDWVRILFQFRSKVYSNSFGLNYSCFASVFHSEVVYIVWLKRWYLLVRLITCMLVYSKDVACQNCCGVSEHGTI
jgi:hypothetical protein